MGGMKNQDFVAAPPKCMDPPKKKRLYQVWKGRNKFFCGGRLISGPDSRSVLLSTFLIGGPALTFCAKMYLKVSIDDSFHEQAVLIVGLLLTYLDLTFLFITSTTNPGIIPRNSRPVLENKSLDSFPSIDWIGDATPGFNFPKVKDVIINGLPVKVKYCDTCLLYRPPRASHCSICNNCIQRFDHHCPWLNQCIGSRNYRTFIMFITTSTLLCIYVFTFSLLTLLKEPYRAWMLLSGDAVFFVLMIYCFITFWFVGGLTLFHYYLIYTNQTTYENFRSLYGKKENPHNRGVVKNLKEILLSQTAPSLVNFREWVSEEDETFAQSINRKFGWDTSHKSNKVRDVELSIHGKDGKPFQEFLKDYNWSDDSLNKGRAGKTTTNDPFMFPIHREETDDASDRTSRDDDDDDNDKESSQRPSMVEQQR